MAMYEVPPELAVQCLLSSPVSDTHEHSDFFTVLDIFIGEGALKFGWEIAHWGRLLRVSRLVYTKLQMQSFWLRELGFVLARVPPNFSPLRLFLVLRKEMQAKEWERKLLTSAVVEARDPKALTPLVVSLSGAESVAVWTRELSALLTLSTYPTAPNVLQLTAFLDVLVAKGADRALIVQSAKATDEKKRNRVLYAVLAAQLLTRAECGPLTAEDVASLVPDVTGIMHLVALTHGVTVDELKDEKWKLTRKTLPHVAQRGIVRSLAAQSWLGLADAFKKEGLFKAMTKSIHLGSLVKKALLAAPQDAGLVQLRLFLACLRGARYSTTPEAFQTSWRATIAQPLRALCETNPLFAMTDARWLAEWDAALVGQALPKPAKRTVEGVLAQLGNTAASWTRLFDANVVSPAQILANVRSLILLHYPQERVRTLLEARLPTLSTIKLLKLFQFIRALFTPELVADIVQKKEVACKEAEVDPNGDGEVSVTMKPQIFKDAKGRTKEKAIERHVSVRFDARSVERYLTLVESLLVLQSKRFVPKTPAAQTTAVLVHTSELRNAMRAGMPPAIPSYSRTSLWRNEGVCLQQLALPGERFDVLKIGMTWCEAPQPSPCVDLDLSVLMFDANWEFVTHCSFMQRHIPGADHSGDITSAPYPKGAREAVQVTFPTLSQRYPTVRYLAIMVYSYSGQSMDDMFDASVFVANPNRAGSGPGGMDVISAARLTGKGTCNCAGFVALESEAPDARKYFYCVDQTFNNLAREAASSAALVAKELQRITANVETEEPPYVRLSNLAAYYAALVADEVVLAHDDGERVISRAPTLERFAFYKQIVSELAKLDETVSSKVPAVKPAEKDKKRLIVFGGELVTAAQAHMANPSYASSGDESALTLVNLRADVVKAEVRPLGGQAKATLVTATDILELLGTVAATDAEKTGKA